MVLGRSFSSEDTALTRCWVMLFGICDEQNGQEFWSGVAAAFSQKLEAMQYRDLLVACTLVDKLCKDVYSRISRRTSYIVVKRFLERQMKTC